MRVDQTDPLPHRDPMVLILLWSNGNPTHTHRCNPPACAIYPGNMWSTGAQGGRASYGVSSGAQCEKQCTADPTCKSWGFNFTGSTCFFFPSVSIAPTTAVSFFSCGLPCLYPPPSPKPPQPPPSPNPPVPLLPPGSPPKMTTPPSPPGDICNLLFDQVPTAFPSPLAEYSNVRQPNKC